MNSKEYRELIEAYQNVYEQRIGVPLDKPTDSAAARKLQQMIPKGEKVHVPKSGLQKAHYEPEGEQIDEMGPLAGLAVRGAIAAGTALAGKAVYDKAKGVAGKLKQRNIQTQKAIDSLQNSYEPEGEQLSENPLASLDKLARGTAQTVGGTIGGIQGQKTGIPGGRLVGGMLGKQKGGQMYDKAKETVGGLLKQSYEVDGQQLQEKPGDGYLGPTPIPNPIRLAKDAVDATNRATQKRVDSVNKILPGSASMPKNVTYFNKGPSAASQKYLGLKNEQNQGPSTPVKIDPKMGVVPNQGAGRVGQVRLKPGSPASSLIKPVNEQDLFDIVKGYLLDEGYVETEEEALYVMSNMSEETIQDIIEAAVQPSLITSKGKAQNFTKPNRVPFTSSTPVPTRSTTQATPPKRPPGGFGNRPSGQLKLDLNKPAAKPVAKPTASVTKPVAKPAAAKPTAKPNTYRPGATVRATGPGMDKFPQLRKFANQARKVAEPVSKVAGTLAAIRRVTPAGVAASVMAPKPAADATLKGALKSGVYKPKQGPANPDQGLTKAQSFDKSFKAARKSGAKQFTWNNKTYTTKVKESYDDFDLIQDYLIGEGYADNEKEALMIMANISAEQIQEIKEDLEERRKKLAQRQREQVAAAQERVASHQQARRKKRQKAQEREQIKDELRKEMRREAVGDPISPSSVFKLSDPVHQKNLQSTMKPAGPAPMKPAAPKPKQQSSSGRFVKRIVGSTMLSPL